MKLHLIAIATAAALASGIGAASAADHQAMPNNSAKPAMQSMAKDNLSLTRSQQRTAWRDISKAATSQKAPGDFTASVGATIPNDLSLKPVPARVATRISSLKPYDYALLHGKLLIVNPNDKKVVDVINRRA
jgi:hypothetical protein